MAKSEIEWTDFTWNPWHGCKKVSDGCKNCYMFRDKKRYGQDPTQVVRSSDKTFYAPLKLKEPQRVFTCSWSDFFIEEADEWRDEAFAIMALTPQITYQVLTKRPERMLEYMAGLENRHSPDGNMKIGAITELMSTAMEKEFFPKNGGKALDAVNTKWPLSNVHLGVSVEDQKTADERIPLLLKTPAAVRFLSIEPLLGPVDLEWVGKSDHYDYTRWNALDGSAYAVAGAGTAQEVAWDSIHPIGSDPIDWVIVGGESGPNARPMHPDWVRSIRDQCIAAEVPFFFKQWGEFWPYDPLYVDNHPFGDVPNNWKPNLEFHWPQNFTPGADPIVSVKLGKKKAGRILDGRTWDEFPEVI